MLHGHGHTNVNMTRGHMYQILKNTHDTCVKTRVEQVSNTTWFMVGVFMLHKS